MIFPCAACQARDMHIMSLKEELRKKDEIISSLREIIQNRENDQNEIIRHITGMNRAQSSSGSSSGSELKTVSRNTGIFGRIAHAEKLDREQAEPLKIAREREYRERIQALERPETEVSDAIQESSN